MGMFDKSNTGRDAKHNGVHGVDVMWDGLRTRGGRMEFKYLDPRFSHAMHAPLAEVIIEPQY